MVHGNCVGIMPHPEDLVHVENQHNENSFNEASLPEGLRLSSQHKDVLRFEKMSTLTAISKFPMAIVKNLGSGYSVGYFEVRCIKPGQLSNFSIGVGPSNSPKYEHPGKSTKSVGYFSENGNVYFHDGNTAKNIPFGPQFFSGEVIGCGVTNLGHTYFTHNGVLIGVCRAFPLSGAVHALVTVLGIGTSLHVNWGSSKFVFNHAFYEQFRTCQAVPKRVFDLAKILSDNTKAKLLSISQIKSGDPNYLHLAKQRIREFLQIQGVGITEKPQEKKSPITWTQADVLLWMKTLHLSRDYHQLVTTQNIDGDVLMNDLHEPATWREFGFEVDEDIIKLKEAKVLLIVKQPM